MSWRRGALWLHVILSVNGMITVRSRPNSTLEVEALLDPATSWRARPSNTTKPNSMRDIVHQGPRGIEEFNALQRKILLCKSTL
jgi:hypothetical protein